MSRLWQFLTDSRVLVVIGLAAFGGFLYLTADTFEIALVWALIVALAALAAWGVFWLARRQWRKRIAAKLGASLVATSGDPAGQGRSEVAVLRKGMLDAINTIKTSKLGLTRGAAALYELPWYMIIGNPSAGKSSAIAHSGLTFPIPGSKAVQGVGGTRNCDWFFTTDGILLDTAGRYSVVEDDRSEWFGFLDLLRKYRRRAPINGIIIAVSVAELATGPACASMELARSLRTRVQELTERLGVHAPVYVVFTKADLVAGFADFFYDSERSERDRIWGATLRYNRRRTPQDVLACFDQHFDELHHGLQEMSIATMSGNRSAHLRPGVFTFPVEFASIKSQLRAFLATLFEENTYQFKPVFRGFYFTSALREGSVQDLSSKRVASRFGLELPAQEEASPQDQEQSGYFLLDLFRRVIFADRDLVKRYASPAATRLKYALFLCAALLLGASLGGWTWSWFGNQQLVADAQADLDKAVRLQDKRIDLQSRLEALDVLHDRISQLEKYREDRPLTLSFGLYQGDRLDRKLRDEFFGGMREVMVQPVTAAIEQMLVDVNANASQLDASASAAPAPSRPGELYQDVSPANVTDAYNALKTYLMLSDKSHAEASHLNDQLTRYWRRWLETNRGAMPHDQMIRSAERLLTFYASQAQDQAWPQIQPKLTLLDSARENLRHVVRGTPARERVYAEIKARASTRFPLMTVARIVGEQDQNLVAGSYAVSGAFSREAWDKFVQGAIREAANKDLQTTDWVLRTTTHDDLTLEGSPDQIQKTLVEMYKTEYAKEWGKFVQGVTVADLNGFDAAVQAMNRLGDPQASPIAKLLKTMYEQTSWDNPGVPRELGKTERGLLAWFKEVILRRAPSDARTLAATVDPLHAAGGAAAAGPIGRAFAGIARLVGVTQKDASLMTGYLDALSRLRTRLNTLRNQGDPGPGAKTLMQQTLDGSGSELDDALKYVDEQMLIGMSDSEKQALRPLLVRPLMQTFAMIVMPSEAEINKTWQVQVLEPFRKTLSDKYPFTAGSRVEASTSEIAQLFGPDGAVAKFVNTSMGPLVTRRGDLLEARTWAELGLTLSPQVVSGFPNWVAPLSANGVAQASGAPQQVFQVQPLPAPGTQEYTIEIDGQQLRYRNTPSAWTTMTHPGPQGVSGARVSAVTFDGRTVELFSQSGEFGLQRLVESAARKNKPGGVWELSWSANKVAVTIDLRVTSSAAVNGNGDSNGQARGFKGLRLPETIVGHGVTAPTVASLANGAN